MEAGRRRRSRPGGPIRAAAELLRGGEILAVKGLGGFHLACDATDGDAVRRLKRRKRRPHKPLAVMFADLDELRAHCRVDAEEEALLTSPEHPIVLLEWRDVGPAGELGPELGGGEAATRSIPRSPSASAISARCCPTRRCTSCCCARPAGRWS